MSLADKKQNALYAYGSHAAALTFAGAAGLPMMAALAIVMLAQFVAGKGCRFSH
jgi:hypothetical protein